MTGFKPPAQGSHLTQETKKKKTPRDHVGAPFEVTALWSTSKHDSVQLSCLDADCVMSWTENEVRLPGRENKKLTTHSEEENCKTSKSVPECWSNVSQRTTAASHSGREQSWSLMPPLWLWIIDQMHLHNTRPSADVEQLHTGERLCQCAVFSKETFARHFPFPK